MSISAINLETLVSNAYYCKKNFSYEKYLNQTVDLIYQGFYNFDLYGGPVLDKYRAKHKYPAFTIVHNYFAFFVYNDGTLYQKEYDAYCKFCDKCGHKFYSPDELLKYRKQLAAGELRGTVSFIRMLREHVNSSFFQNFIYGMVMLSLMDSSEFSQATYMLIQAVLSPEIDNCPSYQTLMSQVFKW